MFYWNLFVDNEETKINVGGITITRDGYRLIMDDMGAELIGSIRKKLCWFSTSMKKESVITGLPVVPFNQSKHSDVCQYLEYVQSLLLDIYKPEGQPEPVNAGDILKKAKSPVAGDLLGRARTTGAKNPGLGCDSPSERFTNIVEVPALWHTNQSFLGFILEQLYQPTAVSGREPGTL